MEEKKENLTMNDDLSATIGLLVGIISGAICFLCCGYFFLKRQGGLYNPYVVAPNPV